MERAGRELRGSIAGRLYFSPTFVIEINRLVRRGLRPDPGGAGLRAKSISPREAVGGGRTLTVDEASNPFVLRYWQMAGIASLGQG